jgi:thiol:disulfide interchange protein DsbD
MTRVRFSSALLALLLTLAPAVALAAPGAEDAFTRALSKGPLYAALAALAGGFAVSLTPCVYPMVAVTVSIFGARQAKHRWEGALLSSAFVAGIIAMLVPLGVAAGLSGSMFGSVLQSRWVVVGISVLFLVLAASMFGAFEMALPSALTNKLAAVGGLGYKGAFLLGLACGLIATPCTGPVLTGILTWIANSQSAGLGALVMTTFGLGLGLPFFLVGAFALQLPKGGHWMVHVKSVLGLLLVVVALYFLGTTFPVLTESVTRSPRILIGAGLMLGAGVLLGAIHREFAEPGFGIKLRKGLGIVLVSAGGFLLVTAIGKPSAAVTWEATHVDAARAKALDSQKPLLVDFTAAWCGACKELDKKTFSAPAVGSELSRFVAVKVDATNDDDPAVEATLHEFKVVGLPTVLVFDSKGKEAIRYRDFVPPEQFLEGIRTVR